MDARSVSVHEFAERSQVAGQGALYQPVVRIRLHPVSLRPIELPEATPMNQYEFGGDAVAEDFPKWGIRACGRLSVQAGMPALPAECRLEARARRRGCEATRLRDGARVGNSNVWG